MKPRFSAHFQAQSKKNEQQRLFLVAVSGVAFAVLLISGAALHFTPSPGSASEDAKITIEGNVPKSVGSGTVYVAKRDIAKGAKLAGIQVSEMHLPLHKMPEGALRDRSELETLFAAGNISAGMPLTRGMTSTQPPFESSLPVSVGNRAITLQVDAVSGIEGYIDPGTLVDVAVTFQKEGLLTTKIIVQRARVISYGGKTSGTSRFLPGENTKSVFGTATLDVSLDDSIAILTGRKLGSLALLARSPLDTAILDNPEVNEKRIRDGAGVGSAKRGEGIKYCGQAEMDGTKVMLPCSTDERIRMVE